MGQLSLKALEIAKSQIGQEEKPRGSNWGHPVQDYLASVGINFPASWCAAFMYWCFSKAAKELGVPNTVPKTGGVLHLYQDADGVYRVKGKPQVGNMFIMDLGKGLGHIGIIESIDPDGTLNTIEGNTNDTGSREGYEVARRKRQPKSPIIAYLDF